MSPDLTLDEYTALLIGFDSLHRTLDREIEAQLATVPQCAAVASLDFRARRKSPALARDLAALGAPPRPAEPFCVHTFAGALGALYVCEGASLGGRIIAPHVARTLGAHVPISFFASYGDDVPRMWKSCRRVIDQLLRTAADITQAATVANALFDRFAQVLA